MTHQHQALGSRFVIELSPGIYLVNLREVTPNIGEARLYDYASNAKAILNIRRTRCRPKKGEGSNGWPWLMAEVHELEGIELVAGGEV